MAFVFKAERKIDLSGKENATIGPGAYIAHKDYKPKPQVHQPFQIQTGRDASTKTQVPQTVFNPGPGSYKAEIGFDQISKSMQSAKNLSMYGLEKFGITVIKQSNCFASKVDRFQDKDLKEKGYTPGPGQYVNDANWVREKRQLPKPEWQQIQWNRTPNPPSIPSHDNVFGYEENPNGELIKQKNTEKVHTGVKADTVGPGEYEIAKPLGVNKKGPAWHNPPKNQKKAPATTEVKGEIPGPGHYNSDKVDIFPIYKYKPSSVFVSKVARDKQLKNGMPPKPQSQGNHSQNALNTQGGDDDYWDDEDDEGQTPGPGSYFNPHSSTTFKIKNVPERLQFFGSTVERFNYNLNKNKIPPNVGPGSYQVNQPGTASKKMRSSSNAPFLSTDNRFIQKDPAVAMPGPGTYQAKTIVEQLQKKTWGKQGVFGSTEKRFVQAQTLQTPGPGMYKPERTIALMDKKNDNNIKRSSSMFISHTKRNPYEQPKHMVPIVQYDDKTNTISDNVRKQVEAGVGNPLLANLKAKRGVNPAFSSNAQRFPDHKVEEAETFLGPGYYEHQSTFETKSGSMTQVKSTNFLSNAPRFIPGKNKVEVPGPGHYSNEDLNNWYKRSYNMTFTE